MQLADRHLPASTMLDQIEQVLRRGRPSDPPAYTLILGAGASFGSVPTSKQMLGVPDRGIVHPSAIPAFLHELETESTVLGAELVTVVEQFWQRFLTVNADLTQPRSNTGAASAPVVLNGGVPDAKSIPSAYQALFDQKRTGGINTAAGARDYLRHITIGQNELIRLNGTHFFLASLLSLQRYAQDIAAREKGFYVGKRPFARTIFTTNFDPLLQVSLQLFQLLYYMTDRPDLLASDALQTDDYSALHLFYAHGSVHRPFLANTEDEIDFLGQRNARALAAYLGQHGVIVLGYSGWDDCLLRGLIQTSSFANNLYWLARGEASLSPEVREFLVTHPNSYWVDITDGGQFMSALHRRLCPGLPFTELLQNPIPFLKRRLQLVELSSVTPKTSVEAEATFDSSEAISSAEGPTTPEEFRQQVLSLLAESEAQFEKLVLTGDQTDLKRLEHHADLAFSSDDWTRAIELYGTIIERPGIHIQLIAKALNRRGTAYGNLGREAEEIADYDSVIGLEGAPGREIAGALINRAVCYGYSNETEKEIADYTRALTVDGVEGEQIALAIYNRAIVYDKLGRHLEEINDLNRLLALDGVSSVLRGRALFNRAVVYGDKGDSEAAIVEYTSLIEASDIYPEQLLRSLVNRAHLYRKLGRPSDAIADYSRIASLPEATKTQIARAFLSRAIVREESGELDAAVSDYRSAIALQRIPIDITSTAMFRVAFLLAKKGDHGQAITDYTRFLELSDVSPTLVQSAMTNRAAAFFAEGKGAEAIADYTKVLNSTKLTAANEARALLGRANVLASQGDASGAVVDFKRAASLKGVPENIKKIAEAQVVRLSKIGSGQSATSPVTSSSLLKRSTSKTGRLRKAKKSKQ